MDRWLKKTHKVLLELTLIVLHLITYGFIIWSVLCHHGIIDCAERTPAACACHHLQSKISPAPKKPASSQRKKRTRKVTPKKSSTPRCPAASVSCRNSIASETASLSRSMTSVFRLFLHQWIAGYFVMEEKQPAQVAFPAHTGYLLNALLYQTSRYRGHRA